MFISLNIAEINYRNHQCSAYLVFYTVCVQYILCILYRNFYKIASKMINYLLLRRVRG